MLACAHCTPPPLHQSYARRPPWLLAYVVRRCAHDGVACTHQISMQWVLFTVAIVFARADVCARLRMHATASPLPVGRVLACV